MSKFRIPITALCLMMALLGSRWASQADSAPAKTTDELSMMEIPFRQWASLDMDLLPREMELLQPEATLMRRYENDHAESVELLVIAGRHKKSVHTPGYCLPGSGWEMMRQETRNVILPDRQIPVTHALMTNKEGQRIIVMYFFTDGHYVTNSIGRYQVNQLFKRFRRQSSMGALVRVLVPIQYGDERAEELTNEFTRAAFPKVLSALRELQ